MLTPLFLLGLASDSSLLLGLLACLNIFIAVFGFRCFFRLTFVKLLYVFYWILLKVILAYFLILFSENCFRLALLLVIILGGRYLLTSLCLFQILELCLFFLQFDWEIHLWWAQDLMAYQILIILSIFDIAIHIFILNLLYHLKVKESH